MTLGNIIGGVITKFLVALINLAILVVSSRYLGVVSRGEISLFLLNIALVQLVCEIYTGWSLVHFIPRWDSRRLITGGILTALLVVPVANGIILAIGQQVPGKAPLAIITSFLVVLNTFNCVILLGRGKVRQFHWLSMLQPALLAAGLPAAVFLGQVFTFDAFAVPLMLSFFVAAAVSAVWVARLPRLSGEFSLAPVIRQGLMYQAAVIMFLLANRFSYYVLPGVDQVGLYAAASSIMDAALVLASGMAPALLSRLANDVHPAKNALLTLALAKLSVLITLCCAGAAMLVPAALYVRLLGTGFEGLRDVMLAYTPGLLLASFLVPLAAFFTASGRQRVVLLGYGAGFLMTICFAPALIGRWGVHGAAGTAFLSYLVMAVVITLAFSRGNSLGYAALLSLRRDLRLISVLLREKQ